MARLRAVVVIQAPGLSGTPSRGQRSSATTNASWTASSARSKSPRTRMSVATARPDSSRNSRSTTAWAAAGDGNGLGGFAARQIPDGPDLDGAVPGGRDARGHLDRLVDVPALDEVEAAELLLGLRERTIGRDGPPVIHAHGGRRRRRLERLAGFEDALLADRARERVVGLVLGGHHVL